MLVGLEALAGLARLARASRASRASEVDEFLLVERTSRGTSYESKSY